MKSRVNFNIYGPIEDRAYWGQCKEQLDKLPPNIIWNYYGDVPSEDVQAVFQKNDIFLFPTLGENYGHVIFEALSTGCIPVISDQTPWERIAENRAGFIIPIKALEEFTARIEQLHTMPAEGRNCMAENAVELACETVKRTHYSTGYRTIFG